MSYQFPKRVLRTGDVLDPSELTDDFSRPAERVSGRLNAHNFRGNNFVQPFLSGATVDPTTFYQVEHYYQYVPFDWSAVSSAVEVFPDLDIDGPADAYLVNNNFEWQTILDDSGNSAEIIISTGTSVLWINAYAQYLWHGFYLAASGSSTMAGGKQHYNEAQKIPCSVQFALRIDGNIVEETITGIDDPTYRSSVPLKPLWQRNSPEDTISTNYAPGPRDITGAAVSALGPPCLPVRLGACIPVQPGEHVIELVVRRSPYIGTTDDSMVYGQYDRVFIYNRQVNVIDLKVFDVDSSPPSEVTVPAFSEENALSASTLYAQRLQPTIAAYNAIESGAVERGAFTHYHIPDVLLGCDTVERGPYGPPLTVTHRFNNWFPGNGSTTITLDGYNGSPTTGWKLITDVGNADPIKITNFTVTEPCKILIFANLQLRNIYGEQYLYTDTEDTQIWARYGVFALFQIMWQYAGAGDLNWIDREESLGMVNNFVWWPKYYRDDKAEEYVNAAEAAGLENAEIQLMAMLDFQDAPLNPINIGLFGSCVGSMTEYNFLFGSITAIALRR